MKLGNIFVFSAKEGKHFPFSSSNFTSSLEPYSPLYPPPDTQGYRIKKQEGKGRIASRTLEKLELNPTSI